jgi:hypothetical protein
MKHLKILFLLSLLSRFAAGQERGQTDTANPASARRLQEVTIRAARPPVQQNITGTVVNVAGSLFSKGRSVLEVLEQSPGVTLDRRNNSIGLNGRSGVTVMIDGKLVHMPEEELLEMLRGMNADNIERIELLTAPGAKYDASGSAGVINIILKKNKRLGTTGAFSVNGGYGHYEKGGGSINLDHNNGKTDWYGSYSFQHDHTYGGFYADGSSLNPALGGQSSFIFHDTTTYRSNNHNALVGVDTRLKRGWTAGAGISYNNSLTTSYTHNRGIYTDPQESMLYFDGIIRGRSQWDNIIASVTSEKDWGKGQKLGLGIDWLDYSNNRPSDVRGNFVDQHGGTVWLSGDSLSASLNKGFSTTQIRVGVAKLDYSKVFTSKWRLEVGAKVDHTGSKSGSGIESLIDGHWVTSAASADAIRMREDIAAGYASLHGELDSSTTIDLGLRYEYSDTRLDDAGTGAPITQRRLGVLFPNLLLTRKSGGNGQWQLSFTRRITRPSYKDLSSFISYGDPFAVFTGNPLLKPTITSNLKLGYSWKGYSLAVVAGRDDDPIFRGGLTTEPGSKLVYIRPVNMDWQNNLNFELNLPFRIGNWWTMSYGFIGGWRQYQIGYIPVPTEKTWFGYSVNIHENFRLSPKLSAELSGWYEGTNFESTNKGLGTGQLSAGLKKELGKGSLQFTVTDLFRTLNYKTYVGAVGEDAFHSHNYISYDPESRKFPILRLTYSRSFGAGLKSRAKTERAGEEKERIK